MISISHQVYTMKHKPRGVALIVNNFVDKCTDKLGIRDGTKLDEIGLNLLFNALYFHVDIHRDKTVPVSILFSQQFKHIEKSTSYFELFDLILNTSQEKLITELD